MDVCKLYIKIQSTRNQRARKYSIWTLTEGTRRGLTILRLDLSERRLKKKNYEYNFTIEL